MEIKNWKDSNPHIPHKNGVEWTIFVRTNTDPTKYYKKNKNEETPNWGSACMENIPFLEYGLLHPGGNIEEHINDYYEEIYFIISGEGTMSVEGEEYKIKEGDAIYLPIKVNHGIINNSKDFLNYLVFAAGNKHPDSI